MIPSVKLIVAVDRGNSIGWSDGRLPWHIPEDMRRFKQLTTGGIVVMGRKTWESLPPKFRPLSDRKNIMLSREWSLGMGHPEVDAYNDLENVYRSWRNGVLGAKDLWIIGGASVYDQALQMGLPTELHLTLVHTTSGADVKLKNDLAAWKLWILRSGLPWVVTYHEDLSPAGEVPACTFLTLSRP